MSKLNVNKNRIMSLILAGFVLVGGAKTAKADTKTANKELDSKEIVYQMDDSVATNLVVNAEDVLKSTVSNGKLPEEYNGMILDGTLTIGSLNQMRENLLNYNVEQLFTNPENFDYVSMGIYMDNEAEATILNGVKELINAWAKNPSDIETLDQLINVFRGNDKELSTALLSVGGKQALANDVYFTSALTQAYGLDESYVKSLSDLSLSYGYNGDIITYINTIEGKSCTR